jgi:hypothetical protein
VTEEKRQSFPESFLWLKKSINYFPKALWLKKSINYFPKAFCG